MTTPTFGVSWKFNGKNFGVGCFYGIIDCCDLSGSTGSGTSSGSSSYRRGGTASGPTTTVSPSVNNNSGSSYRRGSTAPSSGSSYSPSTGSGYRGGGGGYTGGGQSSGGGASYRR